MGWSAAFAGTLSVPTVGRPRQFPPAGGGHTTLDQNLSLGLLYGGNTIGILSMGKQAVLSKGRRSRCTDLYAENEFHAVCGRETADPGPFF